MKYVKLRSSAARIRVPSMKHATGLVIKQDNGWSRVQWDVDICKKGRPWTERTEDLVEVSK